MDLKTIKRFYELGQLAFVIIDPQKRFAHAMASGKDIPPRIVSGKNKLTRLGIQTHIVFMREARKRDEDAWGGLIDGLYNPATDNPPIRKHLQNALQGTTLKQTLDSSNAKGVLMAGYNVDQCFKTSLFAMRAHFKVAGLSDCVGSAYQGINTIAEISERIRRDGVNMHKFHSVFSALTS